ncbi:hypothetical protein JZX87_10100 [Agrobacterium sp. Ap1]|uniref:hypothetical protein n=1 Tax=Agrobacterium sp. Ap1 TaxID=2815337 RepID=UPI001A8DEF2E|nr:hypothetical protein [Agrobacterium sp. Ap1]MBO0141514.1 hypothetical protein [Agrobacterium sp. Ap1]
MSGAQFRLSFRVAVFNEQIARTMRGFFFNMEADTTLVRVRLPEVYGIDGPYAAATRSYRMANALGIPFATDAMYATGVGHAVPTLETSFRDPAALNDREIYVTESTEIPGGCALSIDEFCYGIAGSWIEGGVQRLRLSPVLRKPAAVGDMISLAPVFVGVCVSDSPGFDALSHGRYGEHSLEFVEDLTRLVEDVD